MFVSEPLVPSFDGIPDLIEQYDNEDAPALTNEGQSLGPYVSHHRNFTALCLAMTYQHLRIDGT